MSRRLPYEAVVKAFEERGLQLLDQTYVNCRSPLRYRCKQCGHEDTTRLEAVKDGNGCPNCWSLRRGQSRKHSYEFVRDAFLKRNLELLDPEYINSQTPLHYHCLVCNCTGHLRLNDLLNGIGCRACGIERRAAAQRLDFGKFKEEMHARGIEVLSQRYVNSQTKLDLRCRTCRYGWRATANDLRSRKGCPKCGARRAVQARTYTTDFVRKALAQRNITLLSPYLNSKKPILVRFEDCGHEVPRIWNTLQQAGECPKCARNARVIEEDYRRVAQSFAGEIVRIGAGAQAPSLWKCSLGHTFSRSLSSIRFSGTFCSVCSGSYAEMFCRKAVDKLFGKPFKRVRIREMKSWRGRPLELDIHSEELRLAVEHNGPHHYEPQANWSGGQGLRLQRLHDRRRRKFCRDNGIILIEIRELGKRTSLEDLRKEIRAALLKANRTIPEGFDSVDLTDLPKLNESQVYWTEVQTAAHRMGLEVLGKVFEGSQRPIQVKCSHGHLIEKTPLSILQGHGCHECYLDRRRKPLMCSDGRLFESGTAAARALGVIKEVVNTAVRKGWKVRGLRLERISHEEFQRLSNKPPRQ
jgi:hypothetical protein